MTTMTTPVNSWLDQYALPIVTDKESAHAYKQPTEMMPNFKVRCEFSVTRPAPYAHRAPAAHSTHASAPQTPRHTLRPSHPCTLHLRATPRLRAPAPPRPRAVPRRAAPRAP